VTFPDGYIDQNWTMKRSYFLLPLLYLGCSPVADHAGALTDADALFERNAATARQLIFDFEQEREEAKVHFADSAVWTPTRHGQTDTIPLEQAWSGWKRMWAAYDLELLSELVLLPGVDPETKEPDGSVRVYFDWRYTKPATDSTVARTADLSLYEAWEFDADGKIWMTQLYGDIGATIAALND